MQPCVNSDSSTATAAQHFNSKPVATHRLSSVCWRQEKSRERISVVAVRLIVQVNEKNAICACRYAP